MYINDWFQERNLVLEEDLSVVLSDLDSLREDKKLLEIQLKEKSAAVEQVHREADRLDAQLEEVIEPIIITFAYTRLSL